jgi:DNA-binding HxlR family transcriptional regulator
LNIAAQKPEGTDNAQREARDERTQEPTRHMATQSGQLGVSILRCLSEEWTIPVLRELEAGSLRPSELDEHLPRVAHAALTRLLRDLRAHGVVRRRRSGGLSPQADYTLSESAPALMAIAEAAERWARNCSPPDSGRRPATRLALRLTADEMTRAILLALADEPLSPARLDERLPQIGRSAARERLVQLERAGIVRRTNLNGPHRSLTPSARRLSLIVILANRWERQWEQQDEQESYGSSDIPGLLQLVAPVVQIPEPLAGVCQLRIATDPPGQEATGQGTPEPEHKTHAPGLDTPAQDVYLVAEQGRLAALRAAATPPHAAGMAPPEAWYDALLHKQLDGVRTSGNEALLAQVLESVSAALVF